MKLSISAAALVACLATPLTSALGPAVVPGRPDWRIVEPIDIIYPDSQKICDSNSFAQRSKFFVFNNITSIGAHGTVSQCTTITMWSDITIVFETSFDVVKYYDYIRSISMAQYSFEPVKLRDIDSIPSSFDFKIDSSNDAILSVAYRFRLKSTSSKSLFLNVVLETVGGMKPWYNSQKIQDNVKVLNLEGELYFGWDEIDSSVDAYTLVCKKVNRNFQFNLMEFFNSILLHSDITSDFELSEVSLLSQVVSGSGKVEFTYFLVDVNHKSP